MCNRFSCGRYHASIFPLLCKHMKNAYWLSVYIVISLFVPNLHASISATSSAAYAEKCDGKELDFKTLLDVVTPYPLTFVPSEILT